jgi:hypothetical protein
VLSLPMFPELTAAMQSEVAEVLIDLQQDDEEMMSSKMAKDLV